MAMRRRALRQRSRKVKQISLPDDASTEEQDRRCGDVHAVMPAIFKSRLQGSLFCSYGLR
ncbi:hypothetical protein EJB05_41123, partial [Eragrostis curvula]